MTTLIALKYPTVAKEVQRRAFFKIWLQGGPPFRNPVVKVTIFDNME